jgi:hypothetical protein
VTIREGYLKVKKFLGRLPPKHVKGASKRGERMDNGL